MTRGRNRSELCQRLFWQLCCDLQREAPLDPPGRRLLARLSEALGLPRAQARLVLRAVQHRRARGELGGGCGFDPELSYERACALALGEGDRDPRARHLLGILAGALGVPPEQAARLELASQVTVEVGSGGSGTFWGVGPLVTRR